MCVQAYYRLEEFCHRPKRFVFINRGRYFETLSTTLFLYFKAKTNSSSVLSRCIEFGLVIKYSAPNCLVSSLSTSIFDVEYTITGIDVKASDCLIFIRNCL